MDDIDRAQAREEELRADALAEWRRRNLVDASPLCECEDCGETIPEARRAAVPGVRRCVWCQAMTEWGQNGL